MADANSYNHVVLLGFVTKDPEGSTVKEDEGKYYCKFSVATNEAFKGGRKKVEYHRCIAWGKNAEFIEKYIKKGRQILCHGKLRHRAFDGREGKVFMTEVHVERVVGIGSGKEKGSNNKGVDPF